VPEPGTALAGLGALALAIAAVGFGSKRPRLALARTSLRSLAALVALAITLAAAGSSCLAQNLLPNGSFEQGDFSGVSGVMVLGDGSTAITGWQAVGGSSGGIQWLTTPNSGGFLASEGLNFLNLVGTPAGADGAGVQLELPLPVVAGQYYELTFDLGTTAADHSLYTDPTGFPGPGVQVTIGGSGGASQGGYFFVGDTSLPNNDGGNRWTSESTGPFQATGDFLSIGFSSIGYGGETFIGLDNVNLTSAPEASTISLMATGALVFLLFRRRSLKREAAQA